MCIARKHLINLKKTRFYHCSNRIIRRSYLCGYDPLTNKNYDYRREWIIRRIKQLSANYAIEVCAYAIMANHYHLVLKVNLTEGIRMTPNEVVKRWTTLHPSREEIKNMYDLEGKLLDDPVVRRTIRTWKRRLLSISWFMSDLNYNISRKANKEDGHKGHFWEGRFASQALEGNVSLLNCMAYVDLNPVRAGIATNLLECLYTSLHERITVLMNATSKASILSEGYIKLQNKDSLNFSYQPAGLTAFSAENYFNIIDYLKLVDLRGRQIRVDKKGYIKSNVKPILKILGLNKEAWRKLKHYCSDSRILSLFKLRVLKINDVVVSEMFS